MLALLSLVAMVNTVDKIGFAMLLQPVKTGLHLSDSQMGFLGGPAYAVMNSLAGLPLARLADRGGRVRLIACCVIAWSFFTTSAAGVRGIASLAATRAFVGFAEAGTSPASQSLIAARFPAATRAGAMAILLSGSYVGILVGFSFAGLMRETLGWRWAFAGLGVPGLGLAALLWYSVAEPADQKEFVRGVSRPSQAPRSELFAVIRQRAFVHLTLAVATGSVAIQAVITWLPAYYERRFAMTPISIGFWLGTAVGLGSIIGALLGGKASDAMFKHSNRISMWPTFWSVVLSAPCLTLACATETKTLSIALLMASTLLGALGVGPIYATLQELSDPRHRSIIAAIFGSFVVLIGQGAGPLLVGAVSDLAARVNSADGLRISLVCVSLFGFWPAVHFYFLARRTDENMGKAVTEATFSDKAL